MTLSSAEQASGDKQAEIAILTARIETIEGELIATRANVEEREVGFDRDEWPGYRLTVETPFTHSGPGVRT